MYSNDLNEIWYDYFLAQNRLDLLGGVLWVEQASLFQANENVDVGEFLLRNIAVLILL